jgi:SAM-dependent methyltransferase
MGTFWPKDGKFTDDSFSDLSPCMENLPSLRRNAALAWLKNTWRRAVLKRVQYSSDYRKLDIVYTMPDPWQMTSSAEQCRFAKTNEQILEKFGRVHSILEIGCGEGHQSLYLQQVCDRLTGLDVSSRAIRRARSKCPQADFIVGDMFSEEVNALAPFDIVVSCEVLYYMNDPPSALQRIRTIGRSCFLTYFDAERETLDRHVVRYLPGADGEIIECGQFRWHAWWWSG